MNMAAILDTSFLIATFNNKDKNHASVIKVARELNESLVLPISVLPEVCYLIASRMGHFYMRRFLTQLAASNTILEAITLTDLQRVAEILEEYADSQLDFVDATIVAIAERLNINKVLTLDRRDFSIIRPRHCSYFDILP
ncbi:PilT protein domain protein [Crinalium epipsammum PCC 9333]|uniref:Ribonuclease VapC n=2 Tax=Crinalium TaxID=241421 RepID=K9VWH0_9CYAN|nr:PilT protein domain protein [Crinalium epipsammum PCC 9333]